MRRDQRVQPGGDSALTPGVTRAAAPQADAQSGSASGLWGWLQWVQRRTREVENAGPLAVRVLVAAVVLGALFVMFMARLFTPSPPQLTRIPYSEFKQHLGQVAAISASGRNIDGEMKAPVTMHGVKGPVLSFTTRIPNYGDADLESMLEHDGVVINDPTIAFEWDVVQSAMPFSALAAILAGFVVVAIVAMLTFKPNVRTNEDQWAPLVPFLGAFFTLVLAAFLFSVLAGVGGTGGNRLLPLTEGYFLSWIFGCGVVQTCVGIAWLMEDYDVTYNVEPVRKTARGIVHLGVILAAAATSGVLVQPLFVLYPDQGAEGNVAWVVMGLLPLAAIPIGALLRPAFSPGTVHLIETTYAAMALVLVATIGYGVASGTTEQAIRSAYGALFIVLVLMQVLLCALFAAYEAVLPLYKDEKERVAAGKEMAAAAG